jgi:hypothetical protein
MRPLLVDEVDGLVLDVLAQDSEVVAVIKLVLLHCRAILARMGCGGDLVVGVVPAGLGSYFLVLTPDLRPGLSYVAPAGAGVGVGRSASLALDGRRFAPRTAGAAVPT